MFMNLYMLVCKHVYSWTVCLSYIEPKPFLRGTTEVIKCSIVLLQCKPISLRFFVLCTLLILLLKRMIIYEFGFA